MPTNIFSTYADKYKKQTSAEALFFHSSTIASVKGLRVLLPDKGLEFSDNSYVGTDPAGFFYYDDLDKVKTANKYVADNTTNPKDDQLIAWVKFYKDNTLVGEFLGDDYFNVVTAAGMVGYSHSGQWKESSAESYVEAFLKKDANSSYVTLDISKAIKRKGTMTTSNSDLKASSIPSIKGHFHYDNLDNVSNGTFVSYSNDRLVFYNNDYTGTAFTGYFIPNGRDDSQTILGIYGSTELTLSGTKWDITN
ncbi:hypothetical protein GGX14DRAFT_398741 [Mycena pura]|uniref:Uncharacterized protein n=1 Tax=Mycena pura TaxID=153505 RepID=A0AAD6YD91_9AGAR|nr:hypothetical protein GGX14DRAFT_398741 [Mycena pura]